MRCGGRGRSAAVVLTSSSRVGTSSRLSAGATTTAGTSDPGADFSQVPGVRLTFRAEDTSVARQQDGPFGLEPQLDACRAKSNDNVRSFLKFALPSG